MKLDVKWDKMKVLTFKLETRCKMELKNIKMLKNKLRKKGTLNLKLGVKWDKMNASILT